MYKILNKAALLLFLIINIINSESLHGSVIALLLTITLSAFIQVFEGKKLSVLISAVQLLLSFINPVFCSAIPLLLYDMLIINKPLLALGLPVALIINFGNFNLSQLAVIICGAFVAFLLWRSGFKLEKAEKELIRTRDSSEEVNILLQDKNRHLIENQDNEINLATMKERNRIAREIHDNVGHMLTRSILQVGALNVINKDETVSEGLITLKDTLNNAMTSIRNSVHNLHDDSINLKLAIDEAIKPLESRFSTECTFDFSETMPKNIKLCFIGIAKECVSNAIKHSSGDKTEISLIEHPAFYRFSFTDNGKCDGIIKESGIGISNIRERAASVNGIANIISSEDGFKVNISVPK